MSLNATQIEALASEQAIASVVNYFYNREEVLTKHPLISSIFPEEYKSRSVIGGLETSLGTSLWEKLALELASLNKIVMHHPSNFKKITNLPDEITSLLNSTDLSARSSSIVDEFLDDAKKISMKNANFKPKTAKMDKGHGADLYFEISDKIYIVDIKTVQWNAAGGEDFLKRMLKWASFAVFFHKTKNVNVKLVIPYNPFQTTWWQQSKKKAEPLWETDILVGSNFWDLLTGLPHSYSFIEKGFKEILNHPAIEFLQNNYAKKIDENFQIDLICKYKNLIVKKWNRNSNGSSGLLELKCNSCKREFRARESVILQQDYCPNHEKSHVTLGKFEELQQNRWYGLGMGAENQ